MSPRSRSALWLTIAAVAVGVGLWFAVFEPGEPACEPESARENAAAQAPEEPEPAPSQVVTLTGNPVPAKPPTPPPAKPAATPTPRAEVVLPTLDDAELQRKWQASLDAIAGARSPQDREALLAHLKRFVRGKEGAKGGSDPFLKSLWKDRSSRTKPAEPLAVADEEEAERRRIEQLQNLIKRNAVGLLGAIDNALVWMALHQGEDGRISEGSATARCAALGHDPRCVAAGAVKKDDPYAVASTALSALAFLDFRDQDARGLFEPYLAGAIGYLLRTQRKDGLWDGGGPLYNSAIALMALGQAAASTDSEPLRAAVQRGLERLATNPGHRGGYKYQLGVKADLSVTAWVTQALEAARAGGVEIPRDLPWNLLSFLEADRVAPYGYAYEPGPRASGSLRPAGMLCERILGDPEDETLAAWRAWMKKPGINAKDPRSLYTLYYGVRLAILLDGGIPEPWRTGVFEIAGRQAKEKALLGSWDAQPDPWFNRAGRTGITPFATLTLEHALYLR